jgi:hypothetical protein
MKNIIFWPWMLQLLVTGGAVIARVTTTYQISAPPFSFCVHPADNVSIHFALATQIWNDEF